MIDQAFLPPYSSCPYLLPPPFPTCSLSLPLSCHPKAWGTYIEKLGVPLLFSTTFWRGAAKERTGKLRPSFDIFIPIHISQTLVPSGRCPPLVLVTCGLGIGAAHEDKRRWGDRLLPEDSLGQGVQARLSLRRTRGEL